MGIRFHFCKSVLSYASKSAKQINFKIRNGILSEITILLSQSVLSELVLEINAQESNIFQYF